jgi:psiF repeat-containing protein
MTETTLFFGVLGAFVAFVDDHKRCGDLDGGLDNSYVWLEETTMRSFLVALAMVSFVASAYSVAPAADDKKMTPQQEKMKVCNTKAGEKKGDERKTFMSECLKADKKS